MFMSHLILGMGSVKIEITCCAICWMYRALCHVALKLTTLTKKRFQNGRPQCTFVLNQVFALKYTPDNYNENEKSHNAQHWPLEQIRDRYLLKPQSHIHGFGPGRATVHPDLASR